MNIITTCFFVFFARICDVSIGTMRTIALVKGKTFLTPILAFFEVFIWYVAARQALSGDEFNIFIAICYALGYATGNLIGSLLSNKIIKGNTTVQAITTKATPENLKLIRDNGYAVSVVNIEDNYDGENKKLLLIEIDNINTKNVTKLIKKIDNHAFITYNDTKLVLNGFIK